MSNFKIRESQGQAKRLKNTNQCSVFVPSFSFVPYFIKERDSSIVNLLFTLLVK